MSLEIDWEVKTTKATCMIARWIRRQNVCSSELAKMSGKNSAKLLKSPDSWIKSSFKFQAQNDQVWFCNSPTGESNLGNMMKAMSRAASIIPHSTNHCVRATSVTVLSNHDVEARHIKVVTGHKSTTSIESYNARASLQQKENISNILNCFVAGNSHLAIEYQPSSSREFPALPTSSTSSAITSSQQIENNKDVRIQASQAFHFHGCNVSIVNNYYMRWTINVKSSW